MRELGKQADIILDATYQCVARKGYANSSLRDIANEADVTLSQLNYYFGNKEDLFYELLNQMAKKYLDEFKGKLQQGDMTQTRVDTLIEYLQEILKDNPELFTVLFDLASMSLRKEKFKLLIKEMLDQLALVIESVLTESTLIKSYQDMDTHRVSKILLGTLFGIGLQYTLDSDNNTDIIESIELMKVLLA